MTKLIVDPPTLAKLKNVKGLAEICDESGRTVGFFRPLTEEPDYVGTEPPIDAAELRRREQESWGRPLAEIVDDLERKHGIWHYEKRT